MKIPPTCFIANNPLRQVCEVVGDVSTIDIKKI